MTPAQFATYVRDQTHTDSTSFTDDNLLIYMNIVKDDIAKEIAKKNEDYFGMEYTTDLVLNQREYPMPDEILNNIKYVEAKLDGTTWVPMKEFDLNSYKYATDETTIRNVFTSHNPMFDIFRRSLWLYTGDAIAAVIGGLKLWAIIYPANFTDLSLITDMSIDPATNSHGFPRQFHELMARKVIIMYKVSRDKPVPLNALEMNYEPDLQKALGALTGMNLDRPGTATLPYDDGSTY